MVKCRLCKQNFSVITNTHLKSKHRFTIKKYVSQFGDNQVGFLQSFSELSKDDPRYIKWRENLLKRPPSWSKGYTKETHKSVAKISKTFKKKKIDNFSEWRKKAKKAGIIPVSYPSLKQDKDLAFLVGMVLGDGNIHQFPRTECLRITLGTDKPKLWKHTAKIVENVFKKTPHVYKVKNAECMVISMYQNHISKRMNISCGARKDISIKLPKWIRGNKEFLIAYLSGLYEAEGSFGVHEPTYTYKMIFTNRNDTLLNIVYTALESLGFHPHRSKDKIQISKKEEVYKFKDLICFREYK